ncbi:MAG: hypothetical protein JF591_04400, partial [Lysobacter sp.]|nr:hypothetical protein [Lysobacter sp.]
MSATPPVGPPAAEPPAVDPTAVAAHSSADPAATSAEVTPLARAAGHRGDWSVLTALAPYLRPYLGRIAIALAMVFAAKLL